MGGFAARKCLRVLDHVENGTIRALQSNTFPIFSSCNGTTGSDAGHGISQTAQNDSTTTTRLRARAQSYTVC